MLIDLYPIIITSPFGYRIRKKKQEFHPGIDCRVIDKNYRPLPILAPEKLVVAGIHFNAEWGHYILASPLETDYQQLRFWHITPSVKEGQELVEGEQIGMPESGWVSLHLHLETYKESLIDPIFYLQERHIEYEFI
jgi:murein DD-endopeptidase MepM/ murein hydrolase activator NlpD